MKTKAIIGDEKIEEKLLESTLNDIFDFLHLKLEVSGKPEVIIGVQYLDVLFEISCKRVPEKVQARGFEE